MSEEGVWAIGIEEEACEEEIMKLMVTKESNESSEIFSTFNNGGGFAVGYGIRVFFFVLMMIIVGFFCQLVKNQ